MNTFADARPTKRFFISNVVRDLTLEDAILDLIDNSIDAFVRGRDLDVSSSMLRKDSGPLPQKEEGRATVSVSLSEEQFCIRDICGGIDLERAKHEVFRFGHVDPEEKSSLGVYGIGLKRAIFKIGRRIKIESKTTKSGFVVDFDAEEWAKDDSDWALPLQEIEAASSPSEAGTIITVTNLSPEVAMRIRDGRIHKRLGDSIAITYCLFLQHFLTVELNGTPVAPKPIPLASSEEAQYAFKELVEGEVSVDIFAGLADRRGGVWTGEAAGWYVLCNGRVVVSADKTELTGWGSPGPQYVSKYRGFVGIAFFFSPRPAALPWTTTKRGLNVEAYVYQIARKEMSVVARPVLNFLNDMYPSEPAEEIEERKIAENVKPVDLGRLAVRQQSDFTIAPSAKAAKTTINIQYKVPIGDVERIKKKLGKPDWSAGNIGKYTFDWFLKTEFAD